MVVDYSETINRYTHLDAYPLPRIEEMINNIAKYKYSRTIDLQAAYYQVPLSEKDRVCTAFEADGQLWQFTRMPFGVTNGTAVFQRKMGHFVTNYDLDDIFPYMDNVIICGSTQEEHDENLKAFKEAACQENLTLSEEKCVYSAEVINLLRYRISHNSIKPDHQRLEPLLKLPHPNNPKELKRIIGMFSYYAKWIKCFSEKSMYLIMLINSHLNKLR